MLNSRYMVVTHPRGAPQVPIHGMLGSYHWQRLDEDHVLLKGEFAVYHHQALREHEDVSMLPHQLSNKKLHEQMRPAHLKALRHGMGIEAHHTMGDLLDAVEMHSGPLMHPHK